MSAFGNARAASDPRPKAKRASASATNKRKVEKPQPALDEASYEVAAQPTAKTSAPKPVFSKVGDPFVVATADFQQSSTQTPAQRDATRPPGTEQQQSVPPTARPNPPDPRTPPSTQKTAPQTPPGVQAPPATDPSSSERPTTAPSPAPTSIPLG
ncbi:MAG: hypothetical protein H7Z38_14730, partial [Rubrivivax sp.]|nr:hypothetical protein [Pyrinomonadaceae bacterium]